jgi:hypothetical protein
MSRILTRSQLEDERRATGDKGIFARYRNVRCRACQATVFVRSWTDGSGQPGENVPAAYEIMHEHDGCPECRPDLSWEIASP